MQIERAKLRKELFENRIMKKHEDPGKAANDLPVDAKYDGQKVSQQRLLALMIFILSNAHPGLDRGEIVERFYGLPRRYKGYFTDPCMSHKEKRRYEKHYRRAQPAVTKALQRL